MAPETRHLHPPKQARSRRTLERIGEAALALFAEHGVENTSVQAIVARAGSSVGSFYARFDGKDGLVAWLEDRVWGEARERWDEAVRGRRWDGATLREVAEDVVRVLLGLHRADAARRAAFRQPGHERSASARAFHAHLESGISELLLSHRSEIGHPTPERAARLASGIVLGSLRELVPAGGEEAGPLTEGEAVDELTRCLLGYLGGGAEGGAERGPTESVDFFDIWG